MEKLVEPIVLGDGDTLENRDFEVSADFNGGSQNACIQVQGDGVTVRDVRVVGPREWPTAGWARPNTMALRAERRSGLTVERVSIDGLPKAGIVGFGLRDAVFRDIVISKVFVGVNLGPAEPSFGCTFERIRVSDTWGDQVAYPSRVRPGGCIGGDGMALNSLRDSTLTDCIVTGECFGSFKITNPIGVTVRGCRGTSFMVQGRAAPPTGDTMEPARDVLLEDCVFDQGLGFDTESAGAASVTFGVESCRFHRCIFNAAGRDGHGLKLTHDAHATVECCTFRGFNGTTGGGELAHALDLVASQGCTINGDFGRVNHFIEQDRHVLTR